MFAVYTAEYGSAQELLQIFDHYPLSLVFSKFGLDYLANVKNQSDHSSCSEVKPELDQISNILM